jgi:hypothetical protein
MTNREVRRGRVYLKLGVRNRAEIAGHIGELRG